MDNDAICKSRREGALSNSKIVKILDTKFKPDEEEMCGKQVAQNSDNSQNKFDLPSFKCEACPYESIWKHAVKRHQQRHYKEQSVPEGNKKPKYKCETCSYTSNNWTMLKDHQNLHTSPNEKIVAQNESDPSTLNIAELEGQLLEESKPEPELKNINTYTCKQCKYKTNYKVMFESHKKVHLPSKGEEVFRCELCNFNSVYRQSFLRHMKTMHENELNKEEDALPNMLCCIYCGVTSTTKEQFEKHVKMHQDQINLAKNLDHNGKKTTSIQQKADLNGDAQGQNNNVPKPVKSDSVQGKSPTLSPNSTTQIQKPRSQTRRGKYSDVPVKTTKNGLFECEHCSYQTAIRTALVKHQTNHLKSANS